MKSIILILAVLILAATAAQAARHPLAEANDGRVHPFAPPPEKQVKVEDYRYLFVQIIPVSAEAFSNGELVTQPVTASTSGGKIYKGTLQGFISEGYEINHFEFANGAFWFILKLAR